MVASLYGVARPGHLRSRGEQIGEWNCEKKIGAKYLGYREHSLIVYLFASHARNRWN